MFAKHNKGKFILRIEDTDRARLVKESEKAIDEILSWLGLNWDEKYVQSERLDIYKKYAEILKKKNLAYEDEGALRFKMPKQGETEWVDTIGNKKISFKNNTQEDFVVIKSDGFPTYNFASVIDDHLMGISHVIRGVEFISSTPKHIQLYKSFDWDLPFFAHLPVILGSDHQKLSKRHGAESALDYRAKGYLKETLLNFMVLLGWNPGGNKEVMSLLEMIELFDLKDINTASPIFDSKKLEWMNGFYIREKLTTKDLKERIINFYRDNPGVIGFLKNNKTNIDIIIKLAQTRMKTLKDFEDLVLEPDEKYKLTEDERRISMDLVKYLESIPSSDWKKDFLLEKLKEFQKKNNVSMKLLYIILMGRKKGLPLPEMMEIYQKRKVISSLNKILL